MDGGTPPGNMYRAKLTVNEGGFEILLRVIIQICGFYFNEKWI